MVPKSELVQSEKEKLEAKIELLEKANDALKRKMNHLLCIVNHKDENDIDE